MEGRGRREVSYRDIRRDFGVHVCRLEVIRVIDALVLAEGTDDLQAEISLGRLNGGRNHEWERAGFAYQQPHGPPPSRTLAPLVSQCDRLPRYDLSQVSWFRTSLRAPNRAINF